MYIRTVWQMPEYFISTRTSSARTSSRMTGRMTKSAPGLSTTKPSVWIFVVAAMAEDDGAMKNNVVVVVV